MKKNSSFYQNTGFGWWSTGDVAETLRVPGGGDSTKANLVVETVVIEADTTIKIGGAFASRWGEQDKCQ